MPSHEDLNIDVDKMPNTQKYKALPSVYLKRKGKCGGKDAAKLTEWPSFIHTHDVIPAKAGIYSWVCGC
jgi:hypothetical protein